MNTITSFPDFEEWPTHKLYFLNHMSLKQEERNHTLIVTEEIQDLYSKCPLCSERFHMKYDCDEEEWIYTDCELWKNIPYHYPLCWEYAKSIN